MRALIAAIIAVVALTAAACGGGDSQPAAGNDQVIDDAVDRDALRGAMLAHLRANGFTPRPDPIDDEDLAYPAGGENCGLTTIYIDLPGEPYSLYDRSGRVAVKVTNTPECLAAVRPIVESFQPADFSGVR